MERQMFYEGDILFHKRFGWGVVAEVSWNDFHDEHSYFIDFVDKKGVLFCNLERLQPFEKTTLLSFVEYQNECDILQNRELFYENLIGRVGVFWNHASHDSDWDMHVFISKLKCVDLNSEYPFLSFTHERISTTCFRPLPDDTVLSLRNNMCNYSNAFLFVPELKSEPCS